jgi:hypothetical protein
VLLRTGPSLMMSARRSWRAMLGDLC